MKLLNLLFIAGIIIATCPLRGAAISPPRNQAVGEFSKMQDFVGQASSLQVPKDKSVSLISGRTNFTTITVIARPAGHELVRFRFNAGRFGNDFALFQGNAYFPRLRKNVAASASLVSKNKLELRVLEAASKTSIKPFSIEIDASALRTSRQLPIVKTKNIKANISCGLKDKKKANKIKNTKSQIRATTTYQSIDIFAQGDSVFFQKVSNPTQVLASLFNDAEVLYARDLGLVFNLTIDTQPRTLAQPVTFDAMSGEITAFDEMRSDLSTRTEDVIFLVVGDQPTGFVGIANQIGAVCSTPTKHYALGTYYDGAYLTVAHEIGHLLGAEHYNVSPQGIMAGGADAQLEVVKFVSYSKSQIATYLSSNDSCLENVSSGSAFGIISAQFTTGADVIVNVLRFGQPAPFVGVQGMYRADGNSAWLYYSSFTTDANGSVSLTIPSPGQYVYQFAADSYSFVSSDILSLGNDGTPIDTTPGTGSGTYSLSAKLNYRARRAMIKATLLDSSNTAVPSVYCDLYYRKKSANELQYLGSYRTNSKGMISVAAKKAGQYQVYFQTEADSPSSNIVTVKRVIKP